MRETVARSRLALLLTVALIAAAALAAAQLQTGSPERLLAASGSDVGAATFASEERFGGEPIVVDLRGDVDTTLAPENLTALLALERRLGKLAGVRTVVGPGSFVDQAAAQTRAIIARELGRGPQGSAELFARLGYDGVPSLTNHNFVLQLVKGASLTPKERFAWLFPGQQHALVIVRPRAGLADMEVKALGASISRLVGQTTLDGVTTSVAGAPLVAAAASASLGDELIRLVPVALVAMLLALLLGLGLRARALHLLLPAGGGVLVTAGLSWPLGLGFTPATLAALPVVFGIALAYGVHLQAYSWARRAAGVEPRSAAIEAVSQIGPTLLLAGAATVAGCLVLLLAPVPLVDRFAVTLALGVVAGLAFVLLLGGPLLVARDRPGLAAPRLALPSLAVPHHLRMPALGLALAVGVAGLALSAGTHVASDLRELVPGDLPEQQRLERLQRDLGTSGQLRVAVSGRDVTDPEVLVWMARVEPEILALDRGLRPGPNLATLLRAGDVGPPPDQAAVKRLLGLIPPAVASAVLTPDHRRAELSFGVPLRSASDQAALIGRIQRLLDDAPAGVQARTAGLLAMSAAASGGLEDGRPWLLLLAAAVVFAMLYAVRRRLDRALIPLLPALLATAVAAVVERVLGLELSPLSAALDPLVLGLGVGIGLLLEARFHEQRGSGAPVVVAGALLALGFAVLALSALPVLRQFGLVGAGELLLCMVAAIVLVPALCEAAERRRLQRESAPRPRTSMLAAEG